MEHILKSRYTISEKVSENPFSVTYRGVFIGTEKPVIIKIYKRGTLNSSLIRSMKHRVRELSLIDHHSNAKVHDGDYGWQGFYYVREHIDGLSIQDLLSRGEKIGVEKGVAIADQVLEVLAQAHARGIVHAALKPSNIFLDSQGLVKVADFVVEGEIKEAMPQKVLEVMENAKYTPPEEVAGQAATPAADIYALGLILYEMVMGKPSWAEAGLVGNIKKLSSQPVFSKEAFGSLPRFLAEIIIKATQPDPRLRFATADEFRESLERKTVISQPTGREELVTIFENIVTQYGSEDVDKESEELEDVGRLRLRWNKEKHRMWLLAVLIGSSVVLGIVYAFLFGR